jgi:hypothetical protein
MCPDCPDTQFWNWMNWVVQLATAVGTIGAVLVALFGRRIIARWWPPDLRISPPNPVGVGSPVDVQADGSRYRTDSRWYHVEVENRRRAFAPAVGVQVFLQRLDVFDAALGEYSGAWASELPLRWRTQEVRPMALTIGPLMVAIYSA